MREEAKQLRLTRPCSLEIADQWCDDYLKSPQALRNEQGITLIGGQYRRVDECLRLGVFRSSLRDHG
jgi:hypothetical protein